MISLLMDRVKNDAYQYGELRILFCSGQTHGKSVSTGRAALLCWRYENQLKRYAITIAY
jgi:hypothetical protein